MNALIRPGALGAVCAFGLLPTAALSAQDREMTRAEYFRFVPLTYPRIVRETAADSVFDLYGARSQDYQDVAPRDGVDDARGALRQALGVRFAPFMIRNTSNIPLDMQEAQRITGATLLTIDRWNIYAGAQLLGTEAVDFAALGDQPCPVGAVNRDSLLALVRAATPTARGSGSRPSSRTAIPGPTPGTGAPGSSSSSCAATPPSSAEPTSA